MNKKSRLLPIFILLTFSGLSARELRTPYGLDRGPFHYPIPCRPTDDDQCWNIDVWGAGLHRQANKAFIDKDSFDTDPSLAGIVFGRNSFVGLDAFAPGTISPQNPFLAVAQITPTLNYRENSAYFGIYVERQLPWGCDCAWRGGVRVTLPFRAIDINQEDCCDIQETLDDFCCMQNERIDGSNLNVGTAPVLSVGNPAVQVINDCFAYRLDFLTALFQTQAGVLPHEPFVNYTAGASQGAVVPPAVTMGQSDITQPMPNSNINNPINLIRRVDGTKPEGTFCEAQNVVNTLPFLNGDGSGGANNDRLRGFDTNANYAALAGDTAAQRQLWVVPSVQSNAMAMNNMELSTDAQGVSANIRQLVANLPSAGAIGFFNDQGVDFGTQHLEGLGQMVFEFYANRDWCDWFFEGIVGFNAPTGVKVKDPGQVYKIFNTGNNRHWGIKLGGIATYDPLVWFHLRASTFYWYFVPRTERVAAPFAGATVKNIGPAIDAKISWNQWVGRLDTVWLMPCNPRVGFLLGYEAYLKSKDKVSLKQTTATDFLGFTRPLDANVLERRTKVVSHKVRTEMFHQGSFWELFAGWTHVFAGRNAPKETDWHIGLIAYF